MLEYHHCCNKSTNYFFHCSTLSLFLYSDGNWANWEEWSVCTQKEGATKCMRERRRFCTDPAPAGEGKYCSLDGSSCEDRERCFDPHKCPEPPKIPPTTKRPPHHKNGNTDS